MFHACFLVCLPILTQGTPSVAARDLPRGLAGAQDPAPAEDERALLAAERLECDLLRRRGSATQAERRLGERLEEAPSDVESLILRARCRFDLARDAQARADVARALDLLAAEGPRAAPELHAAALRLHAAIECRLGHAAAALERLGREPGRLAPALDARDAWALGSTAWAAGRREVARVALAQGADAPESGDWEQNLARGLCQRRLGRLEAASESFVKALDLSHAGEGDEPDVLVALGDLYFEADKEVEAGKRRSPAKLYRSALEAHASHEGAWLGLHALHRYNWQRQRESSLDILARALAARPDGIEVGIVATSADLDDGQLKSARERLGRLESVAPGRREVRTLRAALCAIEHKDEEGLRILARLAEEDPLDATPEREVGRHLLELYRFAEARPYVLRATERDPQDHEAFTLLGRALANTGDEAAARAALDRAQAVAAGRQDAWRDNMRLVLQRMNERHTEEKHGELSFSWEPEGGAVLSAYLVPFYTEIRAELARRYGFTPTPTTIEVFRRHRDFSVRSTGFEGFPALGVCFGPVVTAVSPLWEGRGTQSWARTSFHEFTHVIHLGLSHNRCPRWITEGLATWEEVNRDPSWTRNMRRELVDALANGDVIPLRELNRAFRGPRILFGYYQGGLVCQMLIERAGFAPIVRLLEAFDRGLDLDQALSEIYGATPEELDRDFLAFCRRATRDLRIEPRWNPTRVESLRAGLPRVAPSAAARRQEWIDGWCTVAWGAWQSKRKLDAEEALRVLKDVSPVPPRALFLRGEIALTGDDRERAAELWRAALDQGADDFRVRLALARFAREAGEPEAALAHLAAAERLFPGFDDRDLSAELESASLLDEMGRADEAMSARERWLSWNAGETQVHLEVARWHVAAGRSAPALALFAKANEVDPFVRSLHQDWGDALRRAGRAAEALREFEVTLLVPPKLDVDDPEPYDDTRRAGILALQAACLADLARNPEAAERARGALALDAACVLAQETLRRVQ